MLDEAWAKAEKKTDPDFKGSIHEQLGLSDKLCPACGAHLTVDGICLNACHLTQASRDRFNAMMAGIGGGR